MKYSILGFNQEKVLELKRVEIKREGKPKVTRIDVVDLMILREIADFMNRKKIIKYYVDDKMYLHVKYSVIIEDLPILNLKQQALVDRLDKLCWFGLLEKKVIKNQAGSFPAFRIGDIYESIVYGEKEGYETIDNENHSHTYLDTSAKVAEYECYNNYYYNNSSTTNNNKEEDTNVSPKKEALDYKAIVDCWNEHNGKRCGKVTKITDKRKRAIKHIITEHDITQDELMRLFKSLPYADSWLYNPTKEHKNWKPDFDWWMANTNGWFTKALEGKVHTQNPAAFNDIMQNGEQTIYTPQGRTIWFNKETQTYWTTELYPDLGIDDGYTNDNRPDGATLTLNNARGNITWDKQTQQWEKQ